MSGISSASLVDLKAELFRKQEEFKKQKLINASTNYIRGRKTEKKTTIFGRKNAGVDARSQKDLVAKAEEENLHEKSRKTLEAKTKLYERITQDSGFPDEDGSQKFLVDFQKKAIDRQKEQRNKEEEKKEESDYSEDEFVDSPSNPDEKWIEYTDSLGRTRTCMKKDLVSMQKKDKELGLLPTSQNKEEIKESSVGSSTKAPTVLNSQEIYCQMLKDKWNKEEDEAQNKPVGPVHYENVRFDEIRTHGVGYFQFSKEESARKEQMDLLNSIRDQTKDERSKRNLMKEKRDNLMAARLKKIKDRQRAKMGLPPEPEIEEEPSPDPKITEDISKEVKPEVVKSPAPVREWDLGKDKLWESEKKYFKERREERDSQFAPPSSYYSSNDVSAPKRRVYQERQYSPPPEKKQVHQKLKKGKAKQQQQKKNVTVKEKTMQSCQVPDLATIPLPGEAIPCDDTEQKEELTSNNDSYAVEYQQPQPGSTSAASYDNVIAPQIWGQPATSYDNTVPPQVWTQPTASSNTVAPQMWGQPTASSNNIVPPQVWTQPTASSNTVTAQMWTQPAAVTTAQNNALYVAASGNQQQSVYPGNVATTSVYQYTETAPTDNVITQQQTVEPEKPKPTIVDMRFVKNVESLEHI